MKKSIITAVLIAVLVVALAPLSASAEEVQNGSPVYLAEAIVPQDSIYYNGHTYMAFTGLFNWYEAKSLCEEMGGYLATLETYDEQAAVQGLSSLGWTGGCAFQGGNTREWIWEHSGHVIGIMHEPEPGVEGDYFYYTPLSDNVWDPLNNEPNSWQTPWDQNVAALNERGLDSLMPSNVAGFICEFDSEYTFPAVSLSWDGAENASGYNIKRSETPGGPYITIAAGVTNNTYIDTTVVRSITYYYVVSPVVDSVELPDSNEISVTPGEPVSYGAALNISASDTAGIGNEFVADVVINNAHTICAEDIKIKYDTDLLEYLGAEAADGMRIYKEADLGDGTNRYITASLGKDNAAEGDRVLFHLRFRAKAPGQAKIDIINGRIADNGTLEEDVDYESCGEKTINIGMIYDINRTGEFTLLDLGIAAWYYGDPASETDTSRYDVDVIQDGTIDDNDLAEAVAQMLANYNYSGNN
ncbi:hypothetical protein DFR58_105157 [Anaerobacterium chartisolvens]|uniref:C-type lectin domain-containing protein n=1 Tax=Anaerobacterium chartisolvens TaxID=1297424 RepID=A0A369BA39_9FIRM|nr:cohesin domain-containing protein [Anaerobacterium chartisolvens]RCX18393.1 hypothetical protein DFR58_105157 [Anaerobacterium chartisolvens]